MKSKFYLVFILAGIFPVAGLAAFYLYTVVTQTPSAPVATSVPAPVNTAQQLTEVQTIASSILNAIKNTNVDAVNLASHHSAADLDTFIHSHTGVSGVVVMNPSGKALRTSPVTPPLVDANYGSTTEFAKILSKFKENGNKNYQFYTNRLGYPAFVFAVPLPGTFLAEAVLNIKSFFRGSDTNGQYFILDAGSGQFLYHSDASKLNTSFNPQHEPWLNTVQTDLMAHKDGLSTGPGWGAAYGYLGLGSFGVVHTFPLTVAVAAPAAKEAPVGLPEAVMSPMGLGFLLVAALFCIGAAIASRLLIAPFRRVVNVILAATDDPVTLTPDIVKSFGNDEAGRIVQALALFNEKSQHSKETAVRNLNDQLSGLQRQSRQYQSETQEKAQQLNDKLRELDALKGMTEGLRTQTEQAKTEIARLKNELTTAQNVQLELTNLQGKFAQLQAQLKTAEALAASASSTQVSQVRVAAIRTMSEELKNTLGIIKGYVSSVIGAGQGGINEKQQEFLGMVINRSARLEKFINDLVDIYQVEIEQKDAKTEEVDLASEIETLAFNFQTQTELKNLKFKVEAKPGLPKVPVVRRRLTQLWNVIYLQLIKDSPKGSTIPIILEPSGENVKVTLNDPGLIVTPEALPKLFDEFYDPKHPASPQLAGTGLKLALVKTILTAYGGSAIAEKAEMGTRLILTFGTKVKSAGATTAIDVAPATPSGVKPVAPSAAGTTSAAKPPLDLDGSFGLKPAAAPSTPKAPLTPAVVSTPGLTVGAKPPMPATPGGISPLPPIPGLTVGAKPPAAPGTPMGTLSPLPPIAGLTVGAKPPMPATPGGISPLPPIPGLTVGAKPPAVSGAPSLSSLPPIQGLSVGSKPPMGADTPTGVPSPLPPMQGLIVGAKPPSAGIPSSLPTPGAAPKPSSTPGMLEALISGKIPSVTAPGLKPAGASPVPPATPIPPSTLPKAPIPTSPAMPSGAGSLESLLNKPPVTPPPSTLKPKSPEDDFLE